jgi:heat shock protein HslJ
MTITLGVSTKVACPPDSLSDQYTALLGSVASYGFESGNLILELSDDAGSMGFVNGGSVIDTTTPGSGGPTATTTEPLNVRSGPGTEYYSYGIIPAGTTLEVVGKNAEGTWWAVNIPTTLTSTGVGWVSGDYVVTENTGNVPVLSNPPNVTPTPTSGPSPTPGATGTPGATATTAPSNPLPGSSWSLASMNGLPPISGTTLTIAFGDSTVSGSGGCNNFNGSYSQSGSTINIGQLAITGVLCGTDIDQQEQTYFNLLQSANSYQIVGNQLVLFVNGAEVLRFN